MSNNFRKTREKIRKKQTWLNKQLTCNAFGQTKLAINCKYNKCFQDFKSHNDRYYLLFYVRSIVKLANLKCILVFFFFFVIKYHNTIAIVVVGK